MTTKDFAEYFPSEGNAGNLMSVAARVSNVGCIESFLRANRHRDGLLCSYFCGDPVDLMTADAKHTFLVVPGVWAREIIRTFDGIKRSSLGTDADAKRDDFHEKYLEGSYGVVFEMSFGIAYGKLKTLGSSMNKTYYLVRFLGYFS